MSAVQAIQAMHKRCAIYTSPPTAARLLDIVGWTAEADLTRSVLLEPCVGEGAILLEAAARLLASYRRLREPLAVQRLGPRIKGFEFHVATAATARTQLELFLLHEGFAWDSAHSLAALWVQQRDFLLATPRRATHVAANPPYVRWGKLPPSLATEYRNVLRPLSTRGDVAVAFLDKMLEWAKDGGRIAALVSDRWMFAQYGAEFVEDAKKRGWALEVADERPEKPFVRQVGAYSAIVRLTHGPAAKGTSRFEGRADARRIHSSLVARHGTMHDAGCIVRVGPALGCGRTFLVDDAEAGEIEGELIWPFVGRESLKDGKAEALELRVVVPYDPAGSLIRINEWPAFCRWVSKHEKKLKGRSHFRGSEAWWRTIDAVGPQWRESPKLLVPELCKEPMASVDTTGGLPAHSLYAIWPGEWPVHALQRVLNAGLLLITAHAEAPMLKQGWFRFYKRFLTRTPLPKWKQLSARDRRALTGADERAFGRAFNGLFGFLPGKPPISIDEK